MKIVVVSGGHLPCDFLQEQIEKTAAEYILCADSGANALYLAQIHPNVLLGDFDSINEVVFQYFIEQGIKTVRYQAEKDVSDTEIAIEYALSLGATDIVLLGATGTRLDHTLANLFILEKYAPLVTLQIIDPHNRIELLINAASKEYGKGHYPYISLLPLSKKVKGVTTYGLKYPLDHATLERKSSYGLSNEIINDMGTVTINKGVLAVIQSMD